MTPLAATEPKPSGENNKLKYKPFLASGALLFVARFSPLDQKRFFYGANPMTNLSILSQPEITMTSREIAELTGKRHDSVKRTIESLLKNDIIRSPQIVNFKNANNATGQEYEFCGEEGKRDSYIVVAQLSPEFTARLVDRWQELEAKQVPTFEIPTTLSGALRLAADQAEVIEAQQLLLEQQKPAVQFLENFVETKSTKGLREVAKVLGLKEREFVATLEEQKILFRQSGQLLPFAQFQHNGYFEVKTGEANGYAFHQTRFTPKGIAWITKRLGLTEN